MILSIFASLSDLCMWNTMGRTPPPPLYERSTHYSKRTRHLPKGLTSVPETNLDEYPRAHWRRTWYLDHPELQSLEVR